MINFNNNMNNFNNNSMNNFNNNMNMNMQNGMNNQGFEIGVRQEEMGSINRGIPLIQGFGIGNGIQQNRFLQGSGINGFMQPNFQ